MIKVFISHSSIQKPIVEEIVRYIGNDFSFVDKYTFESGKELQQEIRSAISASDIFLLLISGAALDSDWVKYELNWVRDLIDENKIAFCSFIVDDTPITDSRIKPWIRHYLTNSVRNPVIIGRVVRRRINEVIWEKYPDIKNRARLFIGREKEVDEIVTKFYENISTNHRAIIVSGISHIGRKRLLKEVIVTKLFNELHPTYDPIVVQLDDKDSIDSFIMQLNEYVRLYKTEELFTILQNGENNKNIAVELLNKLFESHEKVLINDDMSIVSNQGKLADWFIDIVNNPRLINACHLFVAARCMLGPYEARKYSLVQSHQLNPLNRKHIRVLFNTYAKQRGVPCTDVEADELLSVVSGYPDQVFAIIDTIKQYGLLEAKRDLCNIEKMFDEDLSNLLKKLHEEPEALQLAVIMSQFDFVSYDLLTQLMDESQLSNLMEKFSLYAMFETFGSANQFIRLNPSIADYVNRSKIRLSSKYNYKLRNLTNELIYHTADEALDLSAQIFKVKSIIKRNKSQADRKYLLPSFALKVIYEQYNAGDYDSVIEIADTIIKYKENTYDSVLRAIRYWLCLSLCRKSNKRLFDEVEYFNRKEFYTYNFILGFYYRNLGNFAKAETFYEKALSNSNNAKASFLTKAEHELSIARMKLGNYDGALEIAQKSYEKFPMNTFNIDAYHRCYVRSHHPDLAVLDKLYEDMASSYIPYKKTILGIFRSERAFYVDNNIEKALKILEDLIDETSGKEQKFALSSLKEMCRSRDMLSIYNSVLKRNQLKEEKDEIELLEDDYSS